MDSLSLLKQHFKSLRFFAEQYPKIFKLQSDVTGADIIFSIQLHRGYKQERKRLDNLNNGKVKSSTSTSSSTSSEGESSSYEVRVGVDDDDEDEEDDEDGDHEDKEDKEEEEEDKSDGSAVEFGKPRAVSGRYMDKFAASTAVNGKGA